jgi:hypothetical protein
MNGSSNVGSDDDSNRVADHSFHDDDDDDSMIRENQAANLSGSGGGIGGFLADLVKDLFQSSGIVLNNKLNWLLILGPIAMLGDAMNLMGETLCFAFSGLALIPCAERYVLHGGNNTTRPTLQKSFRL